MSPSSMFRWPTNVNSPYLFLDTIIRPVRGRKLILQIAITSHPLLQFFEKTPPKTYRIVDHRRLIRK